MLRRDASKLAIRPARARIRRFACCGSEAVGNSLAHDLKLHQDPRYYLRRGGAALLGELTEGRFIIEQFAAGELVPGLQALDAVSNGTVEMAYTAALFYVGKDPTFAPGAAALFMLNPRQQHGWYSHAGGDELFNAFLAKYNVIGFPCGNSGMQWGGWFRKELKSVADLRGLKMRITGLGGHIVARVGVVPPADRTG